MITILVTALLYLVLCFAILFVLRLACDTRKKKRFKEKAIFTPDEIKEIVQEVKQRKEFTRVQRIKNKKPHRMPLAKMMKNQYSQQANPF